MLVRLRVVLTGAMAVPTGGDNAGSGKIQTKRAHRVYVTRSKLKVRRCKELASDLVSELKAGARVHILEEATLADGTSRSCLALEGEKAAYGWVSSMVDGKSNLDAEDEPADGGADTTGPPPPDAAPPERNVAVGNVLLRGSRSKEMQTLTAQLLPAAQLQAIVLDHMRQAEGIEARLSTAARERSEHGVLDLRIGYALQETVTERKVSIAECMKRMDKNQDSQFSKNEFRTLVRAPINSAVNFGLGVELDASAVDQFFDIFVAEGNGATVVGKHRMMTVLKALRARAVEHSRSSATLTALASEARRKGERAQQMVTETVQMEAQLALTRDRWEASLAIDAKVGLAMVCAPAAWCRSHRRHACVHQRIRPRRPTSHTLLLRAL